MKSTPSRTCILLTALLLALNPVMAQQVPATNAMNPAAKTFSQQELDQLAAPIALYPDALLAQIFMASTYPLEVVEAARWSKANPKVSGQALEAAMASQPWDPAVKSLTSVPQVLQQMNENLSWTQKLGDAFLAQQDDLMNTVQALRARADAAGNLKTTEQQVVMTETQGSQTIYVVQSPNPEVVYVPTYNPSVVYGSWWYPTPPYYMYPPSYVYPPGLAFATGVLVGAAIWGNCNWGWGGRNNVNINVNRYNSFNRTNISNQNWNHNVNHRRGVSYKDQNVARQYNRGGNAQASQAREDFRGRAEAGRSDLKGMDRNELNNRVQQADRGAQASTRDRAGNAGMRESATSGNRDRSSIADRSATAGTRDRTAGTRDRSSNSGFSGVGNAASTREASQRGSSSRADFASRSAGSRQSSAGAQRSGGGSAGRGGGGSGAGAGRR